MSAIESELRDILKGYVLRDQAAQAKIADLQIELQAYATLTDAQDRQIKAWRPAIVIMVQHNSLQSRRCPCWMCVFVRALPPEAQP